jgi:hypothetical protein
MDDFVHICVGSIECKSGAFLVSDPSYPFNESSLDNLLKLSTFVNNVRLGEYRSYSGYYQKYPNRVPELLIIHKDYLGSFSLKRPQLKPTENTLPHMIKEMKQVRDEEKKSLERSIIWTKQSRVISVDTGKAGIYDAQFYPMGDDTGDYRDKRSFYGFCCSLMEKDIVGILATSESTTLGVGVISCSGWGNGLYPLYIAKNVAGEIVGIKIDFHVLELESQIMAMGLIDNNDHNPSDEFQTETIPAGTRRRRDNLTIQPNSENDSFFTQSEVALAILRANYEN